ncbi:MAG: alginate O-acetyltransferase [Bacteroidetes bacterium GWF2_29_10]|nr:MAG: alginate O-acetyltransferase [Bacteroidetes bacterium GWF2_29_10]
MLFNSFDFLLFFPIVTFLFFVLPHKFRWLMLLAASCTFYMFFIWYYIFILGITITIDYISGIWIEKTVNPRKKKLFLTLSIISTSLVLIIFKYFNFFITNVNDIANMIGWNYSISALQLILPIGLSFHTFQSLSYVIEVYRGKQKAEKNFGIFSLYVMFYPQLVAGPIERPQNLLHQFHNVHKFNFDDVSIGLKQMLWGFFMKLVVADRASIYVNAVYNNSDNHNGSTFIVATLFFAFQIYCDFAGYSNIAIGSARVMGFKLMQNFDRPYMSKTISEFWKRWHISLSTWFRDYLYISLGGNRVSSFKRYFNLFITFVVSGFWHGASWTFVIWGGLNGFYLILGIFKNRFFEKLNILNKDSAFNKFTSIVTTFVLVCITWVFFRANTTTEAFDIIKKIFSPSGKVFLPNGPDITAPIYAFFAICLLIAIEIKHEFFDDKFTIFNNKLEVVRLFAYVSLILFILMFGVFDGGQFIYFQF